MQRGAFLSLKLRSSLLFDKLCINCDVYLISYDKTASVQFFIPAYPEIMTVDCCRCLSTAPHISERAYNFTGRSFNVQYDLFCYPLDS